MFCQLGRKRLVVHSVPLDASCCYFIFASAADMDTMAQATLGDTFLNCSEFLSMSCNSTHLNKTLNATDSQEFFFIEELLFKILGPKRSSFFLPISLIYLVIFVTGVSGNLLTCAVIGKHKKMRTPTNLYLFSLAVSDLLVLLFGMPLEIYEMWQNYPFPFGEGGCYFKTFLFETVCFASVLNVTALSVERYIAVVHPLKTKYVMTNTHARKVISMVWIIALICAIPNTSLHGIYYVYLPSFKKIEDSATCSLLKPRWIYNLVIQVTTVFFYFIPMTIISVLYLMISCRLNRERKFPVGKLGKNCSSKTSWKIHLETGRRRQINKMLCVVVVVFAICWAPFHIDRLLWSFITSWTDFMHAVFQYVHVLSGVFFYLSSAVNPIIYNLLSTRFRERFKELMCRKNNASTSHNSSPAFSRILKSPSLDDHMKGREERPKCLHPSVISHLSWDHEDETTDM
ncbi:neuromedin-U receptor 2 [Erpetoichthys calabaricus]|uniref:neuromedin-U receptor 2 n=1 Tax=Erpetoichthys calabaricus TaxID=27687 RepID=UPI002234AF09|nr:neuromedin-U receptor 2 [Erpetoichthys calabaricus]